jgi:outer membrane protein assembly factor BamB
LKNLPDEIPTMNKMLSLLAAGGLWLAALDCRADDWANWRGPEQTGVSREKNLPDRWSPDANATDSNLVWKAPFGGRSTPLVVNDRVYMINAAGDGINQQERVMCFDAGTGKVLWEHKFNVWHTDIVAVRLGWTNLAADPETGNVYAHGTQGLFFCFDKDGKVLWSHSLTEEYGRISGYGGRVTSPVVDGNLVIVGMLNSSWGEQARGGNRFLAMDKRTGVPVWWATTDAQPKDTYYSVPVIAVINGERLLISGSGDGGVYAFKVGTGEKAWSYMFGTAAVNCSPVVDGTRVYIGHGEENLDNNKQGRVICLDAGHVQKGRPKLVWDRPGLKIKYCSPVIHEGRLYVCDENAQMYCLDANTGKTLWRHKYGRNAKGSPVWADGKIYIAEVNAKFHILKPGPKSCQELHVQYFPSPDGVSDVEINGSPAIANGCVYFMTRDELFCIGKRDGKDSADRSLSKNQEEPADASAKPTHLQIVPADVALEPGESVPFVARTFDDKGRFLKEVHGQWSLAPMLPPAPPPAGQRAEAGPPPLKGEITPDGKLTVAKDLPGQFGGVIAKAGGLMARARVRVQPRLPYRQDFEKVPEGRTPGGWVNCQGKFAVQQKDGSKVLVKMATNASPLVCRANAFISKPELTDYTIEADVMGSKKHDDMPDAGVVACRYTLMLDGNKQRLRLVSWDALPRVDKSIDWPWKPGQWYHLKLAVEIQGDKAIARGKAWPREQSEPAAWTVEFEDPCPNLEGSPALYGYATGIIENEPGAEIYYDNVRIVPNKNAQTRTSK